MTDGTNISMRRIARIGCCNMAMPVMIAESHEDGLFCAVLPALSAMPEVNTLPLQSFRAATALRKGSPRGMPRMASASAFKIACNTAKLSFLLRRQTHS